MQTTIHRPQGILSKRNYAPRVTGYLLAMPFLCIIFYQHRVGIFHWLYLLTVSLIWPHIAYLIGRRNPSNKTEYKILTFEPMFIGAFLPLVSFNLLPSATVFLMNSQVTLGVGGLRLFIKGTAFFIVGVLILTPFIGFHLKLETSLLVTAACIPAIVLYPLIIGFTAYKLAKKLNKVRIELDNLSKIDKLTEIPNRRRFDEYMDLQWQNSQRSGSPLSVIMIDIDHFKAYNDFYGHGGGDECLKKVAKRLSETIKRPNDMVARYGGEEFVCLLPVTDLEGAVNLAEEIRKSVMSLNLPHEKSPVADYVTISLGVSSINPIKESTPTILLETADKALYEAKNNNRNCVKSLSIIPAP